MEHAVIPILPLTEARTQLFRLADDVLSGQVHRVCLTHRGQPDDLVLMRASTLAQMERELADLRARVAPAVRPLAGLATVQVNDEQLVDDLAALRADANALAAHKRSSIVSGLAYAPVGEPAVKVAERTSKPVKASAPRRSR